MPSEADPTSGLFKFNLSVHKLILLTDKIDLIDLLDAILDNQFAGSLENELVQ